MSLRDWLDERTGWRALLRGALDEPVPGGARWAYVFGSVLAFLFLVQAATGVVMATCYSPSVTTAWASVAYLQDQMTAGWFVRGLHSAGASAIMIFLGLHMLQVTLWGAYKKPREVNWLVGLLLLGLSFGFALTGYLLPWDQKGYWATQVATSLLGATPLVGRPLQQLVLGGPTYGNLTLTRFYALHVFVLPALTALLIVAHVKLFRRHGVTPSWRLSDEELRKRTAPFWPDQLLRDLVAMAVVLGAMAWWTWKHHGAELEAPADPSSAYDARPEWYFLPLFQLLKYFPGRGEVVAAIGAPLCAGALFLYVVWRDRGDSRDPFARKRFVLPIVALLGGAAWLGVAAVREDARNPTYQKQRERAARDAERTRHLALAGVPPGGGLAVLENDPEWKARRILGERCLGCHVYQGGGEERAPALDGWSSRAWLAGLLREPDAPRYYGKTKVHGMKPVKAEPHEIDALVEYVWQQGGGAADGALAGEGAKLFAAKQCDMCHDVDGATGGDAPNLGGRATADWLRRFLRDPGAPTFFGQKNTMPRFGEKLSPEEIDAVAGLLLREREKR